MVEKKIIILQTQSGEIYDITDKVEDVVLQSDIKNGIVNIFVSGSTGALTTIEYEPGTLSDLKNILERYVPSDGYYNHNNTWHDGNGYSHIRSSLLKTFITVPLWDGSLQLGTWQQIVFIECDNRSRRREIKITIIGE